MAFVRRLCVPKIIWGTVTTSCWYRITCTLRNCNLSELCAINKSLIPANMFFAVWATLMEGGPFPIPLWTWGGGAWCCTHDVTIRSILEVTKRYQWKQAQHMVSMQHDLHFLKLCRLHKPVWNAHKTAQWKNKTLFDQLHRELFVVTLLCCELQV